MEFLRKNKFAESLSDKKSIQQLLVYGASAGGYSSLANYPMIREALAGEKTRAAMFSDSSPILPGPVYKPGEEILASDLDKTPAVKFWQKVTHAWGWFPAAHGGRCQDAGPPGIRGAGQGAGRALGESHRREGRAHEGPRRRHQQPQQGALQTLCRRPLRPEQLPAGPGHLQLRFRRRPERRSRRPDGRRVPRREAEALHQGNEPGARRTRPASQLRLLHAVVALPGCGQPCDDGAHLRGHRHFARGQPARRTVDGSHPSSTATWASS
jgi:hypothetical protein